MLAEQVYVTQSKPLRAWATDSGQRAIHSIRVGWMVRGS
jgi:hypothetical protein